MGATQFIFDLRGFVFGIWKGTFFIGIIPFDFDSIMCIPSFYERRSFLCQWFRVFGRCACVWCCGSLCNGNNIVQRIFQLVTYSEPSSCAGDFLLCHFYFWEIHNFVVEPIKSDKTSILIHIKKLHMPRRGRPSPPPPMAPPPPKQPLKLPPSYSSPTSTLNCTPPTWTLNQHPSALCAHCQ